MQKKCYFLLAHEHLHNWIGSKLKNNEQEELNKWFTEGFTDYYARVIALKSGGVSLGEFIDSCNLFLQYYFLSPVINEPNTRIESDYWHNYDIRKLSYYRGFVFAIYLNHLIKQNSNTYSLDNVILDLYNITKHDKDNFSSNLFQKIAKPYVGRSITAEISRFIDKGETIDLAELIDILPIEKSVIGRYDPGFDMAIFDKEKVIRNIKKTSNAYKAGLRDGDVIVRHSFWRNNPNKTMILKTKDKIFRFKPVSQDNKVTIYQIKENLSPEEESAIKQFFNVKL
ncbi:MAG: M61 family peptidase [Rickettsiaceae bacterium]|nr:M61 family peptidase [Rickettsiaceae bacterium]